MVYYIDMLIKSKSLLYFIHISFILLFRSYCILLYCSVVTWFRSKSRQVRAKYLSSTYCVLNMLSDRNLLLQLQVFHNSFFWLASDFLNAKFEQTREMSPPLGTSLLWGIFCVSLLFVCCYSRPHIANAKQELNGVKSCRGCNSGGYDRDVLQWMSVLVQPMEEQTPGGSHWNFNMVNSE